MASLLLELAACSPDKGPRDCHSDASSEVTAQRLSMPGFRQFDDEPTVVTSASEMPDELPSDACLPSAQRSVDDCCDTKLSPPRVSLSTTGMILAVQAVLFAGIAFTGFRGAQPAHTSKAVDSLQDLQEVHQGLIRKRQALHDMQGKLVAANSRLVGQHRQLKSRLRKVLRKTNKHPFQAVAHSPEHKLPEMYGKVKEKTIWAFWYHPKHCRHSRNCTYPAIVQLCVESIRHNKGSFDFKVLHEDEVPKYISLFELPSSWHSLRAQNKKDALMNALLGRYGGVALDISTILLRPLDMSWNEMVRRQATFRGYMYRVNGNPWRRVESTVVWFLMSRREGIFNTATRHQVNGMGDLRNASAYLEPYFAFGDQTLTPILSMFNYSLPKCSEDPTVFNPWPPHQRLQDKCPEKGTKPWFEGLTGPARNDARIILRDPRDGPQLPFCGLGMAMWNVTGIGPLPKKLAPKSVKPAYDAPGGPMYQAGCDTMKSCWEEVFLRRFHAPALPDEARLLDFVKFFHAGASLSRMSRKQLLANRNSYLFHWLKLAGVPDLDRE